MGAAQTCDLTPHELALVQRGMIQFAFGKGAIHKHAVGKVAVLKSLLGERQVSKPFTFTITLCHKILLSAQFFQQSRAAFQHILPGSFKVPGIPWVGHDAAHGGLPYFCAYMVAMIIGECINFPIQRSLVFRSKGNLAKQIGWYLLAFCLITCIVNSINCIWVAVAGLLVPDFIYNIGTTVLNGGISMVIFFFVNKIIFPEGEAAK